MKLPWTWTTSLASTEFCHRPTMLLQSQALLPTASSLPKTSRPRRNPLRSTHPSRTKHTRGREKQEWRRPMPPHCQPHAAQHQRPKHSAPMFAERPSLLWVTGQLLLLYQTNYSGAPQGLRLVAIESGRERLRNQSLKSSSISSLGTSPSSRIARPLLLLPLHIMGQVRHPVVFGVLYAY
jgi:hypothetical protein